MVYIFCGAFLLFKKKGWYGLKRDGKCNQQMGKSFYYSRTGSKGSKGCVGGWCSPNTGLEMDMWPVSTARTEPYSSWCTGCWCPGFCILVSCVMRHTSVQTETLSILSIWLHGFFPIFDRTDHMLNFISQNPSCFVFIFFNRSDTLVIHLKSFIYCAILTFEW